MKIKSILEDNVRYAIDDQESMSLWREIVAVVRDDKNEDNRCNEDNKNLSESIYFVVGTISWKSFIMYWFLVAPLYLSPKWNCQGGGRF